MTPDDILAHECRRPNCRIRLLKISNRMSSFVPPVQLGRLEQAASIERYKEMPFFTILNASAAPSRLLSLTPCLSDDTCSVRTILKHDS